MRTRWEQERGYSALKEFAIWGKGMSKRMTSAQGYKSCGGENTGAMADHRRQTIEGRPSVSLGRPAREAMAALRPERECFR